MSTSIEWCDETWNPVRGCARVSPGCENCYAERQAHRFSGPKQPYDGLTVLGKHGPRWAGGARFVPEMLVAPLRWREPRRVFVNSMSDLFHDDIADAQLAAVFGVMALACHHTYQLLTKRPARMRRIVSQLTLDDCVNATMDYPEDVRFGPEHRAIRPMLPAGSPFAADSNAPLWPLPNVWLGVSCEDQQRANERIPLLLDTPAAVRFISAEPLLGPIDLRAVWQDDVYRIDALTGDVYEGRRVDRGRVDHLDWVIPGGESGPGARPCEVEWIRSVIAQCETTGVACFVKQLGTAWARGPMDERGRYPGTTRGKGGDPSGWPADLRVRQFPPVHPRRRWPNAIATA